MTYQDVIFRLSSRHKNMTFDKFEVIEWIGECVKSIGNLDNMEFFKGVPIEVKNKTALLPCNFYKLDYLFQGNRPFDLNIGNFREVGQIRLNFDKDYTNLTIDYYGVPIDEEGYVAVDNELVAEACYWYCLHNLSIDDWLTGKLPDNRYQMIAEQKNVAMSDAEGSLRKMNKNRQKRMLEIVLNIRPKTLIPRGI